MKSADNPIGDVEIQFTGLRPAEKLYEELLLGGGITGTEHAKIMRASEAVIPRGQLEGYIAKLANACTLQDPVGAKEVLANAVSGYHPHDEWVDPLGVGPGRDANVINLV